MEKHNTSTGNPDRRDSLKENILFYLRDFVTWLVVILLVFILIFRIVVVSGSSMDETLTHGDYLLLVNSVFYQNPKAGDIIVASKDSFKDGEPIIKRVIATEGQWVDIDFDTGIVYVNGTALVEPYISSPTTLFEGVTFPLMVDDGCVFVMGDNRMNSTDSRSTSIGFVDKREIVGKAIFLIIPGIDTSTENRKFARIGALY